MKKNSVMLASVAILLLVIGVVIGVAIKTPTAVNTDEATVTAQVRDAQATAIGATKIAHDIATANAEASQTATTTRNIDATSTAEHTVDEYHMTQQGLISQVVHRGFPFSIEFTLLNTGTTSWSRNTGYDFVCLKIVPSDVPCDKRIFPVEWACQPPSLDPIVAPTTSCIFVLTLYAPEKTGTYYTHWQFRHGNQPVYCEDGPTLWLSFTVTR